MAKEPAQQQRQRPGREHKRAPRPKVTLLTYKESGKLNHKVALITGGDSGIGRAVAVLFASEARTLRSATFGLLPARA